MVSIQNGPIQFASMTLFFCHEPEVKGLLSAPVLYTPIEGNPR